MTKDQYMYAAIALAVVAAYLYFDEQKVLKALKGVPNLPADIAKRVAAA